MASVDIKVHNAAANQITLQVGSESVFTGVAKRRTEISALDTERLRTGAWRAGAKHGCLACRGGNGTDQTSFGMC